MFTVFFGRWSSRRVVAVLVGVLFVAGLGVVPAAPATAGAPSTGAFTFGFDDFSSLDGLNLNGTAAVIPQPVQVNGHAALRVTRSLQSERSSVFWHQPIRLKNEGVRESFSQEFTFRISNNKSEGADGIVFLIGRSSTIVGDNGGGIGYAGIKNSVAVEFDTWKNTEDPNHNHVGINLNGNTRSVATANPAAALENGNVWTGWVDYDGETGLLEVRATDTGTRPAAALVSTTVDIPTILGQNEGYFGLTSATGARSQTIDVLSWNGTGSFPGAEPVMSAGEDLDVTEGTTVSLTGSLTGSVDSLKWEVLSSTGSPIRVRGASTLTPSFRAVDDGTYTLRLTGVAGTYSTSDEVTVRVGNADPVVGTQAAPTASDGLVMVTASVSDPGVADTHSAKVTWGDGTTTPAKVDASPQGPGWGVVSDAHVYEAPGTYDITVTVSDDDDAEVVSTTSVQVGGAGLPGAGGPDLTCALCALGTGNGQGSATIDLNGQADWTIRGGVHSNGRLKIQSPGKLTVEPTGEISVVNGAITCTDVNSTTCPPPHRANAEPLADPLADVDLPVAGSAQQWSCNNSCTLSPGTYRGPFNHNPGTVTRLRPGTYVFTQDMFGLGGKFEMDPSAGPDEGVTLVFRDGASLEIRDQGVLNLRPPTTGPLAGVVVAYDRASTRTLAWRGSRSTLTGTIYAPSAQLRFDNDAAWTSASRFIVGTVSSQTSKITIDPALGVNAGGTGTGTPGEQPPVAAPALLIPQMALDATAPATAAPGSDVSVTTSLSHDGGFIVVPTLVSVLNNRTTPAEIDTATATVETANAAGVWSPLTSSGSSTLSGVGTNMPGTTYPAGDGIAGTTIGPKGAAVWAGQALVKLDAATFARLLDPALTSDLRLSVEVGDSQGSTTQTIRVPAGILADLRTDRGDLDNALVVLDSAQGSDEIDAGTLSPGESHDGTFTLRTPPVPDRADFETDELYLSALRLLDRTPIIGLPSARADSTIGPVYTTAEAITPRVAAPILRVGARSITPTAPGSTATWRWSVTNTGSATATDIDVAITGATATTIEAPESLAPGETDTVEVSLTVPSNQTTPIQAHAKLTWSDGAAGAAGAAGDGNDYGPLAYTDTARVLLPAALRVTKQVGMPQGENLLRYHIEVVNTGDEPITGITLSDTPDAGVRIVGSTLTVSQGQVTSGAEGEATLSVDIGDLGAHATALIDFGVDFTNLAPGQLTVTNQATVSADALPAVFSDDPFEPGPADPTTYTFTTPPAGTDGQEPAPGGTNSGTAQIEGLSLTDGTVVTAPVEVTVGEVTPQPGTTITRWRLETYPQGSDPTAATTIAHGEGNPADQPADQPMGTFDPTTLPNGLWQLRLNVVDTAGNRSWTETTLVVDGDAKLGRYQTTLTDMSVGVAGLPIQIQRSYDSFDKQTGDFGVGWNVSFSNFRIASNGPLGAGGWSQQGCGSGLIFSNVCFSTSRRHFVTVTWPDGRNETFDLTPAKGSTFYRGLTRATFTGRGSATSTLTAVDNTITLINGDLNSGGFGVDGTYNPTDYILTDRYGTQYHLKVGTGLRKVVDKTGNTTTFGPGGITSSNGPQVRFVRDNQDRIVSATGPDGSSVIYTYEDGDLVRVRDQRSKDTTLTYVGEHHLNKVTGPDGLVMARMEYTDGRLTAVIDGEGNRTEVASNVGDRQETITDPGGARTTIRTFDINGDLIRSNEVYGGRNHITEFAYDTDGNVVLRRDPLDREWHATYNDGDLTSLRLPSGAQTTVTYNDLGLPLNWTDADGNATRYTWNSDGTLASITDAEGNAETYSYTGGRRTGKIDRNGKAWAWTYTTAGLVRTERDPLANTTTYEYDANGRQTATIDPLGHRTESTYDPAGNLRTNKDPDGRLTENTYDSLNRLDTTIDPAGGQLAYTYDSASRTVGIDNGLDLPEVIGYDPLGRETSRRVGNQPAQSSTYNGAGQLLSSTDQVGRTTRRTYDDAGRLRTIENPAGGLTTTTYTPDGQVATERDPNGGLATYTYWPTGRLRSETDPLGNKTSYDYDATGRPTITTLPDGSSTEQRYDDAGQTTAQLDAEGHATRFEYDAAGRQVAVVDAEGRRIVSTFDAAGREIENTAPGDATTQRTYSPAGLLRSETTPEGVTTAYTYDPAGRILTTTDELDHVWSTTYDGLGRVLTERGPDQQSGGPAKVTNTYDETGNLASTADALGNTVTFGYDDAGQRTSVTDPRQHTWHTQYSPLGDVQREEDPLGRVKTSTYDTSGRLATVTDPRGVKVVHGYDDGGRLVSLTEDDGPGSISYSYDQLGRRTSMTDATGETTWTYFGDSAIKQIDAPAGTVSYTYDKSRQRTTMTTPAGTTAYAYDPAGRLDTVTDWANRTFDIDYDNDGRIAALTRPNDVKTAWTYDNAGRLTTLTHRRGDTVVDSINYVLDGEGNRTRATTPEGIEQYTLDAVDRLKTITNPAGIKTTYGYDPAGNRTSEQTETATGPGPLLTSTYDDASQLTQINGDAVTHDPAGNLTSALGTTYQWDWRGRLTQTDPTGAPPRTYTYDGDGVRTAQTTPGAADPSEDLLYDRATANGLPDLIRAEHTSTPDADFLHLPDGLLGLTDADTPGDGVGYPLTDALGSVRAVTDTEGAVTATARYNAYGAITASTGTRTRFGYTGAPQQGDQVHLRARDLNTNLGRFLSVDPVRPGAPGVTGWNQYAYVANNPTTYTDPSGAVAAGGYGGLVRSSRDRVAVMARGVGHCVSGAFNEAFLSLSVAAVTGGLTAGTMAADVVLGCVTSSKGVARAADDWPTTSGIVGDASRGRRNFGLGSGTASQSRRAGEAWVGEGFRVASDGKTLVSRDGLRTYRPPAWKPKEGKYQANFSYWIEKRIGVPFGNGHLDISDMLP